MGDALSGGLHGPPIVSARTLIEAFEPRREDRADGIRFKNFAGYERFLSYGDLRIESLRRAKLLADLGARRGDRIVLLLLEEADMAVWFLGAALGGKIPVLIAPRHATRSANGDQASLGHIIADSGARLVLTTDALAGRITRALASPSPVEVVSIETIPDSAFGGEAVALESAPAEPDDICYLQYTSGSTSEPKGTVITHRNLLANVKGMFATGWLEGPHRFVSWMPLYHDFGLVGFFLAPLIARIPGTILSPGLFVRWPQTWLDILHQQRATATGAPNFAFSHLLRRLRGVDLRGYDLSALRVLFCGGEPIQVGSFLAFAKRLAVVGLDPRCFRPCYGLAESTLAVAIHPPWQELIKETVCADELRRGVIKSAEDSPRSKTIVSCGRPLPGHDVEIVGSDRQPLGEKKVGEIRVKGPSISPGYFKNPHATRDSWQDGWLYTGDLGYLSRGHLFVCGRIKDIIIIRGANYDPADIEWTAGRLGEPRTRHVVAFATEVSGCESFVVVVEADLDVAQRQALRGAISAAILEEHGVAPANVLVVRTGTLPVTTSRKVQRGRAREMFEAGALREVGDLPVQTIPP